ncbi:MAG: T9SS type A sorting domain-containing protein [Chitinophagales bacterium]|nr:T9SS type A sorting domain-containing protein [Chitinophagales bacterium]HNI43915.1 T9SS type A sorting domain-containing protein [Chitinophagales bacterium]
MKKTLYLLCSLLLCGIQLLAQNLQVNTTTTLTMTESCQMSDIVIESSITNTSSQPITFVWQRTENNIPAEWSSLVCDNVTCWSPTKNTNSLTLNSGETTIMNIHFKPYQTAGIGTVVITMFDQNNPNNTVAITYTATADCSIALGNTNNNIAKNAIRIYPIPARDNLNFDLGNITNARFVGVYSVIGEKIQDYYIPSQMATFNIPTDCLSAGMYFVRITDNKGNAILSKAFSKVE